jgi:hypothetical protein
LSRRRDDRRRLRGEEVIDVLLDVARRVAEPRQRRRRRLRGHAAHEVRQGRQLHLEVEAVDVGELAIDQAEQVRRTVLRSDDAPVGHTNGTYFSVTPLAILRFISARGLVSQS